MTKIDLTLDLSNRVAREAEAAGLLSARAVERLLREEIQRQAAERLIAGAAQAARSTRRPLSLNELQQEVAAIRKERRPTAA